MIKLFYFFPQGHGLPYFFVLANEKDSAVKKVIDHVIQNQHKGEFQHFDVRDIIDPDTYFIYQENLAQMAQSNTVITIIT